MTTIVAGISKYQIVSQNTELYQKTVYHTNPAFSIGMCIDGNSIRTVKDSYENEIHSDTIRYILIIRYFEV